MAYTPELSDRGSTTLRRLAWFLDKPMTQTMELLLESIAGKAAQLKPEALCDACRDKSRCNTCGFNPHQNGKGKEVEAGKTMEKPIDISTDEWVNKLCQIIGDTAPSALIRIPGVYELLSEHFTNEIIEWREAEQEAEEEEADRE